MRRNEHAVTDPREISGILSRAEVAHLAFLDRGCPAVVPMSFGFEVTAEGRFVFYFHSAAAGRKVECWRADPRVALEAVGDNELQLKTPFCGSSCRYESVIAEGKMELLTEQAMKIHALDLIMTHCGASGSGDYPSPMLERTAVFRLTAAAISGKSNRA